MEWLQAETIQTLQLGVLTISAIVIVLQLYQQAQKHKLDQLIAWKTSLHSLNRLVMENPVTFKSVLYPNANGPEHVKQLTAAYASLHALEVIYYMRKGEEFPPERLDAFLREYVAGKDLKAAWRIGAAHTAFTEEFQNKLNEIIEVDRPRVGKE